MLRKLFRIISVFLAVFVCASAVSCDLPSKTPIEQGYEIISIIDEKMNSDKLASSYGMPEYALETLEALRAADYTGNAEVYQLYMPRDVYFKKLFGEDVSQDDFSETLYNSLAAISASIIAHAITNTTKDYKAIAVLSMTSYGQAFVDSSIDEDLLYLYVFNSGAPIIVSMHPSGNGAVTASGSLIVNDEFNTSDKESIERSFARFGYEGVTAKKVS
jgi:hypothetical protein